MAAAQSLWATLAWGETGYGDEFFKGIYITLFISACAYIIAFGIGMLGAWSKLCHVRALNRAGEVYTTVVRSVPELLLIILIFYAGTSTLSSVLVGLGLAERGVEINPFGAVIAALGIIYGAYLTDVLRGGIQAVPKGQIEAAKAFGMHGPRRFVRIILPQMIRYSITGLGNQWLNITKDSAFVSVVAAVGDIMSVGRGAATQTKHFIFYYGATAIVFMIVSGVSMYVTGRLEKRANRGVRRA
ncbi:MAG: ABC transporter permease subunit [Proteobacteria bacterium]|nr:ABC transporter permease subunit [Pseudomonadota bacterium]